MIHTENKGCICIMKYVMFVNFRLMSLFSLVDDYLRQTWYDGLQIYFDNSFYVQTCLVGTLIQQQVLQTFSMESGWCSSFATLSRKCIKTSLIVSVHSIISIRNSKEESVSFYFISPVCCCGDSEDGLRLNLGSGLHDLVKSCHWKYYIFANYAIMSLFGCTNMLIRVRNWQPCLISYLVIVLSVVLALHNIYDVSKYFLQFILGLS